MKPTQSDKLAGNVWRCPKCKGLTRDIEPDGSHRVTCFSCGALRPGGFMTLASPAADPCQQTDQAAATPPAKPSKAKRGMSKTEARYLVEVLRDTPARYEAITFRMINGRRYTPDFVTMDNGRLTVHEVKGSYRLPSYSRARLAFDQCKVEFPNIAFVWAEWNGKTWEET